MKKVIITGDYHAQYMDVKAFNKMLNYCKTYKPDIFVINGDLVDAFSISKFDKNPNRKTTFYKETLICINILKNIRSVVGKKCEIYWTKGNHLDRLTKYLNNHTELLDFPFFDVESLFKLKEFNIKFVDASSDYDKDNNGLGHLLLGDVIVMHGDARLNGAKYSNVSAKSGLGTAIKFMSNVAINHTHRLGLAFQTSPYKTVVGIECGCLCLINGGCEWQQGFVTFNIDKNYSFNYKLIRIEDL